ncbi:unnamed protein product [Phytophthora fragariaefolia]|uniref:tetraacyldisaccharide 4'-kinase n=1 Tax=Phytophthora fragariaefolia TaxID=1490495 RepID=A0A9W7CY67_9STRA|nr:unnamed protein product [Phytophthora fragariaefolia]
MWLWRHWYRRWHGRVVAALRSSTWPVEALADRPQPALSRVYRWAVERKRRWELSHTQRIAPPRVPVLSVGNVTFGATGKTPFVQFLVDYALRTAGAGRGPLLLTRGYGDDEWRLLAAQFPACRVALGGDRVVAGAAVVEQLGGDAAPLSCIVLDDGLQQWRLVKDLEIVMVDALHPLGNGLLLPCGSLREPPREALARANVVVVHHADMLREDEAQALVRSLRALVDPQRKPIVATSRMKAVGMVPATKLLSGDKGEGRKGSTAPLNGCAVLVVCGVGNPESVKLVVEKLARWTRMEVKAFPDHHAFTEGDAWDVVNWVRELQTGGYNVVVATTEKDFARSPVFMENLAGMVDLRVLQCKLELMQNGDQVKHCIDLCLGRANELEI